MPTINYPFTNSANYTFDSSKIEVIGGIAQLKLTVASGQIFNEDFTDDTGFVYDSSKVEFVGGQVQQKEIIPNATFGANYNTDINGNWGNGTLTGTAVGGASVAGGKLDLKGATIQYVDYNAVGNADSLQIGAIKFNVTPNYSGSPSGSQVFFSLAQAAGNGNNRIQLTHISTGILRLNVEDNVGATIILADLGTWVPVLGTEFEFEINWDITTGATRVFIDGIQFGATATATGLRSGTVGLLRVGNNHVGSRTADFEINDFIVFSAVQHIANYTPGFSVSDNRYPASEVELPIFVHTGLGSIISLDGLITTEIGAPRYIFELGSGGHVYWDGAAWVTTNNTYAQANDVATANTNLPSLTVSGETSFHVHIHFIDSPTQSSVDDLTVDHTANTIFDLTNPTITPITSISQDALLTFLATITEPGSDEVKFVINIDGQDKYWDGATWSNADGTFAQTNTLAEVQTNLAAFTDRGVVLPVIYLHSNDGSTTPNIDDLTISFDFFGGPTTPENVCTVWGFLYDELNAPVVGATVSVIPTRFGLINDKIIDKTAKTVVTDSTGYWEISLIETETTGDIWAYVFTIAGFKSTKLVPDLTSAEFNTLTQGFP